jgi:hypothetical protein
MTTTNRLLLSLLLLALAAPAARATDDVPFEWAGAWLTDGGATRVVDGAGRPGHQRSLEWTPSRGAPVRLAGAGNDATLALSGRRPGAVGISEKLQGEQVDARADTRLQLVATRAADDAEGRQVAEVTIRAGRETTRERWTRRGPTRLEVVSCSVADDWNPKTGPLTLEYRLRGAPARLRLRVLAEAPTPAQLGAKDVGDVRRVTRRFAAYEALSAERDQGAVVVHSELLGEVKAGTHTATWDGRDDTDAKRLVHGGRLLLVVEATDAVARAERPLVVALPVTKLVAPNWPKRRVNPAAPDRPRDMGRDRAALHGQVQAHARALSLSPPGAHEPTATPASVLTALQTSAVVFVATHGGDRSVALYTAVGDDEEVPGHVEEADAWDVNNLGSSKNEKGTRVWHDQTPLRDLHTVVIWACLAGKNDLPQRLLERGCDNVVGFSESIDGGGVYHFHQRLLEGLLLGDREVADRQPLSVSEASRVAAAFATQQVWDRTRRALESDHRAQNQAHRGEDGKYVPGWVPYTDTAPYTDCLVTYTAQVTSGADTHLEVGRWGNSTNKPVYERTAIPASEFTGGTAPSPSAPSTPAASRLQPVTTKSAE